MIPYIDIQYSCYRDRLMFATREVIAMYQVYGLDEDIFEVYNSIKIPKNPEHGYLQLPVFKYAKKINEDPCIMAEKLAIHFNSQENIDLYNAFIPVLLELVKENNKQFGAVV